MAVIFIFNFGLNHRTYINLLSVVCQGHTLSYNAIQSAPLGQGIELVMFSGDGYIFLQVGINKSTELETSKTSPILAVVNYSYQLFLVMGADFANK